MDVTLRSRHYSPDFRAEIATIGAVQLIVIADGWRDGAASDGAMAHDLALAAYFQSAAERRMRTDMFHGTVDEYIAVLNIVATACSDILQGATRCSSTT